MEFLILGLLTGLSLILAIGAQNIFVIEQGLKKQHVFLVCLICSISDLILIFLGIFLFEYFKIYFTKNIELIFNILLFIFLIYFIYNKVRSLYKSSEINFENSTLNLKNIITKTLGFTYLNPHVFSDTILILGGFSKSFSYLDKLNFGLGGSIASLIYFFLLGYGSSYFSKKLNNHYAWLYINSFIIFYMSALLFLITHKFLSEVLQKSI